MGAGTGRQRRRREAGRSDCHLNLCTSPPLPSPHPLASCGEKRPLLFFPSREVGAGSGREVLGMKSGGPRPEREGGRSFQGLAGLVMLRVILDGNGL